MRVDSDHRRRGSGRCLVSTSSSGRPMPARQSVEAWCFPERGWDRKSLAAASKRSRRSCWAHAAPADETPVRTVAERPHEDEPLPVWRVDGRGRPVRACARSGESWALSTLTRETLDQLRLP
ncbi:hypothetical protein C8039_17885 [Halogeometricum sp. wsp3]|nr:hypothetical protein C8039_17885 [Halogeometricum sp. wsp3]